MSVERNSVGIVLQSRTYMMDGLGNVIESGLDGSSGAAILYDAWGNVETDSTAMMRLNTLRFGYKGMLYDETTGLYNARARWYDPEVGRFISEDPIGLVGGMNQYAFAGDDPINASDPSGALVTDKDGSVCSINAESCGDPLTIGAGGGIGAAIGDAGGFGGSIAGGASVALCCNSKSGNFWAQLADAINRILSSNGANVDVTLFGNGGGFSGGGGAACWPGPTNCGNAGKLFKYDAKFSNGTYTDPYHNYPYELDATIFFYGSAS